MSTCSTDAIMDDAEMWIQQDLDDLDWEYEQGLVCVPPPALPPIDSLSPLADDVVMDIPPYRPRPEAVWCSICESWQGGPLQQRDHIVGKKHRKNCKRIRASEIMRIVAIMIAQKYLLEKEYREKDHHVRTGVIVANKVARSMSFTWVLSALARRIMNDGHLCHP